MKAELLNKTFNFRDTELLIVDENEFSRSILRNICNTFRFSEIICANSPAEAHNICDEQKIDLAIIEWSAENTGCEFFIRRLRSQGNGRNFSIPIIALATHCDMEAVAKARDAGITEFMTRPLSVAGLLARITHVFTYPRPFVRAAGYQGPDRRRRALPFDGPERRRRGSDRASLIPAGGGLSRSGGLTVDEMIDAGEAVMLQEAESYRAVQEQDIQELFFLIRELKQSEKPADRDLIERIYRKSYDLKGMGKTFDFQILSDTGDSHCNLLWKIPPAKMSTLFTIQGIEQHAMVMRLIVDQNMKGDGGELGLELIEGLRAIVAMAANM
jgi:two-component system, chemotaxis family, chemotaxis protein CheY